MASRFNAFKKNAGAAMARAITKDLPPFKAATGTSRSYDESGAEILERVRVKMPFSKQASMLSDSTWQGR